MRAAYKSNMAFYRDDPSRLTPIQWYQVSGENAALPFATAFYSSVWEKKEGLPNPVLGEQFEPMTWTNGLPPYPVSSTGICGSGDRWENGCLTSDPMPLLWPGSNVPRCCKEPPVDAPGGLATGGYFDLEAIPAFPQTNANCCDCCGCC